ERLLHSLALGDVHVNADPAQRLARLVKEDLSPRLNPSNAPVGPDHTIFGGAFSVHDRAPQFLFGARPGFGMHTPRPVLVCAAETARRQAEDGLGLFRPDDGVGPDVPFKAAGLRRLLSEVQSLLIYAQRLARALLLVNVRDQNDASYDIAAGVADRSATDADPSVYPIAPMIKDLLP